MGITEAERDIPERMVTALKQGIGNFGVSAVGSGGKEGREELGLVLEQVHGP